VPQSKEERRLKKNALTRAWKLRNRDKVRGYNSKYQKNHMGLRVSLNRKSKLKHPEKEEARKLFHREIRSGRIIRGICRCGLPGQGHHEDYSKPLEVVWLCKRHHGLLHSYLRKGGKMLSYKEFATELEHLKELRTKKSGIEAELKEVNGQIADKIYGLVEHMEDHDMLSVKIAGLGTCSLTSTKKYSIEDPMAFEQWMLGHGEMGNVMAVHAQKVHSYYKEKLELNEELPPGIKTFIKNNITIRG